MGNYTMEVWEVLQLSHDVGYDNPAAPDAGKSIGLGTYPIFDESHRTVLNEKILERFWNREIGQDTISKFHLAMKRRLNELMPFYNKMYLSELIQYDPLATVKLETIRNDVASQSNTVNSETSATSSGNSSSDTTTSGTSESTSASDSKSKSKSQASDTPQNELPDDWEENADYASSGAASQSVTDGTATASGTTGETSANTGTTADTTSATGTNTGSGTSQAQVESTTTGFQGSAPDLLGKYRAQIVNIDAAILDELQRSRLFLGVWDRGEEEVSRGYLYAGYVEVSRATFRPLGDPLPDMENVYLVNGGS